MLHRMTVSLLPEPLADAHGKSWPPVITSNENRNSITPKGKIAMKISILISAIVASVLAAPIASAQDKPAMKMDMEKMERGKSAPAKPAMDMDKQVAPTQENMQKMQQQMDKIATTTDPRERQKLMQEHMQTMQENMKAMRSMGGPMMKGGMAMGDKKSGAMAGGDMKMRQEGMEKRMDMMQMMMEQMMQRDPAAKPMGNM